MKSTKPKTCKLCRQKFQPRTSLQVVCSPVCAAVYARLQRDKAAREAAAKDRREVKARKEAIKTRGEWMKEAQHIFNKYVRIRDSERGCISCGSKPENKYGGTMDCGHYRSVGSAPHLRFNLHNAAAQCVKCNRYLSSNSVEYRKGLIVRIGIDAVDAVERNNATARFSVEYLKRIKAVFSKKTAIAIRRMKCRAEEVDC